MILFRTFTILFSSTEQYSCSTINSGFDEGLDVRRRFSFTYVFHSVYMYLDCGWNFPLQYSYIWLYCNARSEITKFTTVLDSILFRFNPKANERQRNERQ